MSNAKWRIWLGVGLAATSAVLFFLHYVVFHDLHHLGIFTLHDLAFMPLEVLAVTLILHSMIESREKRELLEKLDMLISAFFVEAGEELLRRLSASDADPAYLEQAFGLDASWTDERLTQAARQAVDHSFSVDPTREDVAEMRAFMMEKREFLLGLLGNQSLLQHDSFTKVLWAAFHLGDELAKRDDIADLPESDVQHLHGDMERVYGTLLAQWFDHLRHLKKHYPYLYALSLRTNPLDRSASPIVGG